MNRKTTYLLLAGLLTLAACDNDDNGTTADPKAYPLVVTAQQFGYDEDSEGVTYTKGETLGVYMLTGDKKYISVKKALVNPALIFSVIGFVLFVLKVSVPEAVITFSDFWSTMTSPVAMTVTGMRLAE